MTSTASTKFKIELEVIEAFALLMVFVAFVLVLGFLIWYTSKGMEKHLHDERKIWDRMIEKYGVTAMGYGYHRCPPCYEI